jgi:hypothetical protein
MEEEASMKRIAGAALVILFLALPARADTFSAGLILGYAVLTGDAGDVSDDGLCYGAYVDYFIDPSIAIEGAVLFSRHDDVVDDEGSHTVDVLSFLLGPRFMFSGSKMTPSISFGPSLYTIDYEFEPENGPGTPKKDDDTEAGLFASAGIRFPVTRSLSLSFDLTYHYVFNTDVLDGDMITSTIALGF